MTVEGALVWNLATLMPDGAVGASASGGRAEVLAREFSDEHRGHVGEYQAAELARLCQELERVHEALTVSYAYSMLGFDAATDPSEQGGPRNDSEDMAGRVRTLVTFVEREWIALDDARAEALLADPALGRFAHWLRGVRRTRSQRLSEAEQRGLAEKSVTGTEVRQDSRDMHPELIDRNLDEARDVATAMPA